MRARDLTKGSIAYHDTLNQDVWSGSELRVDVRYKLLEIAKRFVEYLDVPNFKLVDVILRGSLTNYNYTQYSDFDLHIVTNYAALDCDITEPFYMAKKKIWNDEHDITIKGHEVELYVEDRDEENVSQGMYSVLDNTWYNQPKYQQPDIDDRAVNSKARDLMTQINRAIRAGSVEDITRLQEKIRNMRQSGLDAGGEFSTENLAFKIIRNKGYLDRLYKNKNSKFDQELSLDEGIKQNTAVAALVAALSGAPAAADYNYPETQKQDPNAVQKALIILRSINKMKNYGQAGFEAEAQQELNNIMRSMQGMPNQSRVYPIIKDLIKSPEPLPPLYDPSYTPPKDDVNERKKAKKKKRKAKTRRYGYPGMGYYGYYYGGNQDQSDSGGDAGGGGDGGGESVQEGDSWPKVDGGYEHSGLGYKRDRATGNYPVYPLPRWNIYSKYSRNEKGTSMDILHYMTFLQNSYQTASIDINGDEIANTIAKMHNKNSKQELQRLNSSQGLDFNSWHDVYRVLKKRHQDEMIKTLRPKSLDESQARLDPEVEDFLEGLTPDDVGYDDVGDYIVHYEGFTDQCQDSQEYQDDPQAVFNDVWSDFKRRMGDKDPVNYGLVGSEEYPIVYSVFRR